jgi:hypothetical protein
MKNSKEKSKTVSVRVPNDVAEILDLICTNKGLTKSDVLSSLIVSNYNLKVKKEELSPLERLLIGLSIIIPSQQHPNSDNQMTPCIITGTDEDEEYEGKLQILTGDESVIRENDGKFYIFDFHDVDAEPIWLTEKEVLDFYVGQWQAYDFPTVEFNSYHHIRGFSKTARQLLSRLEYFVEHKVAEPL